MKKFIQTEISSFKFAFKGVYHLLKERHFQIHLCFAIAVIGLGFYAKITLYEWIAIVFAIALVLISEAINTVVEKTIDYISLEKHPKAEIIKDMSAGMVLISAITSVVIALLVFF